MLAKVTKLGFLGLNTVKYDDMVHHYRNVIGLPVAHQSSKEAYFSCGGDRLAISFHRGDQPGYRHVGLQVAGEGPLDDVAAELSRGGINAKLKSDLFEGVPSCVQIDDPDHHSIYLYRSAPFTSTAYQSRGVVPDKLGHVALFVSDAQQAAKFYTDVMGFRWSDWLADFFVFLRCNADHHTMNFMKAEKCGLFHVAFELHDFNHLGKGCDILAMNGVRIIWGPGRHGMGHNLFLYHRDPDGNVVEFIADLDRMSDERLGYFDPRHYHADVPQRPKVWLPDDPMAVNSWGAPIPPDLL